MKKLLLSLLLILFGLNSYSQLAVSNAYTPTQLVQDILLGQGITAFNITYTGAAISRGGFINNGVPNLGFPNGVILCSGDINVAVGPNNSPSAGAGTGTGSDPDLAMFATGSVNDKCVLEFDFIPLSDTVQFGYIFASEEYNEFVTTQYNDVFGFFLSGPGITGPFSNNSINIALLPGTSTPVAINNVNNGQSATNVVPTGPCTNCTYYLNNNILNVGPNDLQYDGLTVPLIAKHWVIPCQIYHIKLAIADVGDVAYDSGVFLEANSFSSPVLSIQTQYISQVSNGANLNTAIEGCRCAKLTFRLPVVKSDTFNIVIDSIRGTATMGVDYANIDTNITFLPYHASYSIMICPTYDGISEGIEYVDFYLKTTPCQATDTLIRIPIADYVNIDMTKSPDISLCETNTTLSINISGGAPPYNILWSPSNTLSSNNTATVIASPKTTTNYIVQVKDSTRCSVRTDSIKVTYNKKPLISFMPNVFSGCDSLTVNFNNVTDPTNSIFTWDFGDGTTSNLQNPTHVYHYSSNPKYTVTLNAKTNQNCEDTYSITNLIAVYPQPVASFDLDPYLGNYPPGTNIQFMNTSTYSNSYNWDFGDGTFSNLQNPMHTYNSQQNYRIWFYVYSDKGCKDSTFKDIQVIEWLLTLPNIITPNGDGFNDKFVIINLENYVQNELIVYNRWGMKIFNDSPYLNNWDGDNSPDGTYYYILRYKKGINTYELKGTVTIIR